VALVATTLGLAAPGFAGAGQPILSATDPISLSYAIPITNPATNITISDVSVVTSAKLSSVKLDSTVSLGSLLGAQGNGSTPPGTETRYSGVQAD
jgi:hypothetical protein